MSLNSFLKHKDLPEVLKIVGSRFVSEARPLVDVSSYLFSLGGKHVRPLLTLWSASAFGLDRFSEETRTHLMNTAAGIELIHLATLLHDDIIDNADLRRGKPSAYRHFGLNKTLLSGDFLLVRAFGLCSSLPAPVIAATETACINLTEGEVTEEPLSVHRFTKEEAVEIARSKTAALFRLATYSAAFYGGKDTQKAAKMGEDIGIAFQIIDDILDVTGSEKELGKRPGQDIIEKKPSLVNVLWTEKETPLSSKLIEDRDFSREEVASAIDDIKKCGALNEAKDIAMHYIDEAKSLLKEFSVDSESRDSLEKIGNLIDFAVNRTK